MAQLAEPLAAPPAGETLLSASVEDGLDVRAGLRFRVAVDRGISAA